MPILSSWINKKGKKDAAKAAKLGYVLPEPIIALKPVVYLYPTHKEDLAVRLEYNGKITADAIKGKTEFERNGEAESRDWEAKRASEAK